MKRMLWNQCWWKDIIIAWIPAAMDGMVERSRQSRCHDLEPRVPSLLTATTTSIDFMESKIPQVCGVLGRRLKTIVITEIIIAAGKKFQVNGKRNGWECQPWWGQKGCSEKLKKQKTDRELIMRINNNHYLPPLQKHFSEEVIQKMKDFEQKLVCLLGTLPSQKVPLSQLPKEYYEEKSGKAAATTITTTTESTQWHALGITDARKWDFCWIEKHCYKTIEVVVQKSKTDVLEKDKVAATIEQVWLKDSSWCANFVRKLS